MSQKKKSEFIKVDLFLFSNLSFFIFAIHPHKYVQQNENV